MRVQHAKDLLAFFGKCRFYADGPKQFGFVGEATDLEDANYEFCHDGNVKT